MSPGPAGLDQGGTLGMLGQGSLRGTQDPCLNLLPLYAASGRSPTLNFCKHSQLRSYIRLDPKAAATMYETPTMTDLGHPLEVIGKGHAMLLFAYLLGGIHLEGSMPNIAVPIPLTLEGVSAK